MPQVGGWTECNEAGRESIMIHLAMPCRSGSVRYCTAYRTKDVLQGIKITKVLHAQPPRPVLCMSTWTQVSRGSSVPQPVSESNQHQGTSIVPPTAPTGCTLLLGARVLYASYMRKVLANAYVPPTVKHHARRAPMHEYSNGLCS